jgi:hypothetical protein
MYQYFSFKKAFYVKRHGLQTEPEPEPELEPKLIKSRNRNRNLKKGGTGTVKIVRFLNTVSYGYVTQEFLRCTV